MYLLLQLVYDIDTTESMNYERFLHQWDKKEKKVFLVDMKEEKGSLMFSALAQKTLETYLPAWKRVLVLWGKKWLASGMMCQDCWFIPKCSHCDIPVAYHRDHAWDVFGICHICKKSYQPIGSCPSCHGHGLELFGAWLQKIEALLNEKYPQCTIRVVDGQSVSSLPKIQKLTVELSNIQCLLWTSVLEVPPVWWKPDVVIVMRADASLSVPDWKVAEHCYNMIDATIKHYDCPIIVQAYSVWHHAIKYACKQDHEAFWAEENTYRKDFWYPPYGEMALILFKHEIEETMFTRVNKLYQELLFMQQKESFGWEIFATPPLVYKMYDKYRYNIVLKGEWLRPFLDKAFVSLKIRDRGFKVDWLPENIV